MVQEFYLIYCMPLHVYELVCHCTRQDNSGLCFYVQSVGASSTILPMCHYSGRARADRVLNETEGSAEGAQATGHGKHTWEHEGAMRMSGRHQGGLEKKKKLECRANTGTGW